MDTIDSIICFFGAGWLIFIMIDYSISELKKDISSRMFDAEKDISLKLKTIQDELKIIKKDMMHITNSVEESVFLSKKSSR